MSNPFYEMFGRQNAGGDIISQFMAFKQSYHGNPQEQIQQLLNSGKVTQAQYNAAVAKAKQLQRFLK